MASDGMGSSTGRYWKGFTGCQILELRPEGSVFQLAEGTWEITQMNEMHRMFKGVLVIWSDWCLGLKRSNIRWGGLRYQVINCL